MSNYIAFVASVSSGREANPFFRPRENRASTKKELPSPLHFFFFGTRPILARPEKEFASGPLETLATHASNDSGTLIIKCSGFIGPPAKFRQSFASPVLEKSRFFLVRRNFRP